MDQIFGTVERITFRSEESGFTVARIKMPRKPDLTTIVGTSPTVQPGESVRCLGNWKNNTSHGLQFEVVEINSEAPSDLVGIQKYLESGMVRGIGPKYAERIVKKFGLKTLDIIENNSARLLKVPGIGKKRVALIEKCWHAQRTIRDVMLFLQKYAISPAYAQKIYRVYGEECISRLQENPFMLAQHIPGIGFKMADQIAKSMGFPKEGTQRIDSGLDYILSELASEGHVCAPYEIFLEQAETMLEVSKEAIEERVVYLVSVEQLMKEEVESTSLIWSKRLYLCEKGIARELQRLKRGMCRLRTVDTQRAVAWVENERQITLAENQKEAVACSLYEKVHIITGGPGTGKSTITDAILTITSTLTPKIILAAPTGRAAKRMSEITRKEAFTIHALLQYDFHAGRFRKNRDHPLDCDLIIIDEASMIDTGLMYHLLRALPDHARLLLVGDVHQLPSVGPGNVLKDLMESATLPVTRLTKIFRQAAGSKIITNAHMINAGLFPDLQHDDKSDFFFLKKEEPEEVLEAIIDLVSIRLPKRYRLHPIDQIQVLAPMKKGVIGTENLNRMLQEKLNKNKTAVMQGGRRFAVGDKVMQIRNNYSKEVYNGDIGRIGKIEEEEVLVTFDGKWVSYLFQELDELVLAYATSIHKYQGSECPCVVIPVHTTHFKMLHRNLLYTGVTRGKKLVVLVGTGKAIAIATSTDDVKKRHTALQHFLTVS